jgi:chemotaxis protein MotB
MTESTITDLEEIAQTDGRSAWLMTYADLVTLILVFFVLLFSLSRKELGSITDTLKSFEIAIGNEIPKTSLFDMIDTGSPAKRKKLDQLTGMREVNIIKEINSFISKKNLGENIDAEFKEGKIVLRVEGSVLFRSGSSELLQSASYILSDIIQIIQHNPHYDIDIQGHTDDRPISTPKFASNWELSAIRATTVLRYLIENGVSGERLTATGFADLRPVASNYFPEGRSKNRRVEFVLKENQ